MDPTNPCTPEKFAGREKEKEQLLKILPKAKDHGKVVMISGADGLGKTSFLNWAEYTIQNKLGQLENPVIKKDFLYSSGKNFEIYIEILEGLREYKQSIFGEKFYYKHEGFIKSMIKLLSSMPYGEGIKGFIESRLPAKPRDHGDLINKYIEILKRVSEEMEHKDNVLTIILDNVHRSSTNDFGFLKDVMENLPPFIVLIFTFECERDGRCPDLKQIIEKYDYTEIFLNKMNPEEIKDFAKKNYNLIDNDVANFLSNRAGEPRSLVIAFNRIIERNLYMDLESFQKILPTVVEHYGKELYSRLDRKHQAWAINSCMIDPPIPTTIVSCLVNEDEGIVSAELEEEHVFKNAGNGFCDFIHPTLREYCRGIRSRQRMMGRDEECVENLQKELSRPNQHLMFK